MGIYSTKVGQFCPQDFVNWTATKELVISPKFQRRPVWSLSAKAYFIDTMLREMPSPPIYLRMTQDAETKKMIREVVDGQQRIRSVLEFLDDKFRLAKKPERSWAGKLYSQLTAEEQSLLMQYSFSVEQFSGISDQQILDVFCRLNMNSLPLNKQELRNGKYFGLFKQAAFGLAHDYLEFWREHRIFSERGIARMNDVLLTSELLVASNLGMQDKKDMLDSYYEERELSYPTGDKDAKKFRDVLGTISETFDGRSLADTAFRRPPLFYTLYCVVFHHIFGLADVQQKSPRKKLSKDQRLSLREAVASLSDAVTALKSPGGRVPKKLEQFVAACSQQTDNLGPRRIRFNSLYEQAF